MKITVSDNICVKGMATTCGSKMLAGYIAPYSATVVERLVAAGAVVEGRIPMDEFRGSGVISLGGDVGLYTTSALIPRDGLILTSSINRIKIVAASPEQCGIILGIIADAGREIPCEPPNFKSAPLDLDSLPSLKYSLAAQNIIVCAETASNLGKFDGMRYGFRAECNGSFDEQVKQTRSEGFGEEVKKRILLGNYMTLKDNYDKYYKKALIIREQIKREFAQIFEDNDSIPLSKEGDGETVWALLCAANLAGLPVMTIPGYTFVGKPFCELQLIAAAKEVLGI